MLSLNAYPIIPVFALRDNYIWLLINKKLNKALIIDPGEGSPVIAFLEKNGLKPEAVLITHHHWDHCGGAKELLQQFDPNIPVYGPESLALVTHLGTS